MEVGSLQDRLACRCSGALVPLTANERILVLSDVARGLAYLHSEMCVIHRDVKSANVLLGEAAVAVLVTLASLNPSMTTSPCICRQSTHTGVHCARVYEGRAVDQIGCVCFRARRHRDADWICHLFTGSWSLQLALNVGAVARHW
jgi:hypothetical protein